MGENNSLIIYHAFIGAECGQSDIKKILGIANAFPVPVWRLLVRCKSSEMRVGGA